MIGEIKTVAGGRFAVMPSAEEKTVGLALVTYQSAEDLPGFLETLEAAVEPYAVDVIGIDNVSTDRSADIVEEFGGRVIRNPRNVGLAAAINQGAAATGADWILVANPDTQLAPGSIAALVDTAKADERIGMIGPRIARLDGTPYPSGRRFPSLAVGIAHALLGGIWPANPATRRYFGAPVTEVSDVDWISGCCMLFRREAFEAVGGFDDRYFLYFEETKMALDMHRGGWRVVLDPSVEIRHREGGSMRSAPFRKIRTHHRSALRFYCDYHRGTAWMVFAPLVAAGLVVRGAVAVARTALAQRLKRG
jgi:N-acetylglucosaminyl-diphospho-decaprenol L-rhamnosyltransferase